MASEIALLLGHYHSCNTVDAHVGRNLVNVLDKLSVPHHVNCPR